ncbi:penicillin-binding protein 2 [Paenibacillus sp. UMB4589-SE434]|uniref:peptidoglycan D,D-transpeptidase FtsI family protein n=1 Tax=Paenibacillus sp. UMB4589-SE434 TaxID=3046314 RepID=UPI00254CBA30|nr:penicillin-binding protein 2 [Paenibacillus sp. UMB4589-SE434]MDK8181131.1 penicillin-binding protein 2 [Paenibacillus sp. UMB4589-SE434]
MRLKAESQRWKRISVVTLLISGVLLLYSLRLAWLQFIGPNRPLPHDPHTLMTQSVIQRERGIVLDDGRGRIVDRNGVIITGRPTHALVLFPLKAESLSIGAVHTLAQMLKIEESDFAERWSNTTEPIIWKDPKDTKRPYPISAEEQKMITRQNWNGVRVLPYVEPYPWHEQTPHWIGYTSEAARPSGASLTKGSQPAWSYVKRKGMAGLERSLEPLLAGLGPVTYVHYMDAASRPLHGLDIRVRKPSNPYYPLQVVTTVEMGLQRSIQDIMLQRGITKGAAVVLDVKTRDVVAMVSLPSYDPNHIYPAGEQWNNQAIQAISPGSVFKLVIAAAALEEGITDLHEQFHCDGTYPKYGLSCWKHEGHGTLTLAEAVADSCNVVFAELGERLQGKQIQRYAEKLGLIDPVGMRSSDGLGHEPLKQFEGEHPGRVFVKQAGGVYKTDGGIRAQTGIGQRDVRITPLAAANMMVTLLKGGIYGHPRLVERVEDAKGSALVSFASEARLERTIQSSTAYRLLQWMKQTVATGTGKALQQHSWVLAGKSGTAQATAYGLNELNSWFVGYGPADNPKFAVAVVSIGEKKQEGHRATQIFGDIMDELARKEK